MLSRTIKTSFWTDPKVLRIKNKDARYLFAYLLTNSYINKTGIFEIPKEIICLQTGLSENEFEKGKKELQQLGRIRCYEEWIFVVNAQRHNNQYVVGQKNEVGLQNEIASIPKKVKEYFETEYESPKFEEQKEEVGKKESSKRETTYAYVLSDEFFKELEIHPKFKSYKITKTYIRDLIESIKDYEESKGKKYKDYCATARNWIKNDIEKGKISYKTPDYKVNEPPEYKERSGKIMSFREIMQSKKQPI